MTTGIKLVRLLAATMVGFLSCVFVSFYDEVSNFIFKPEHNGLLPKITVCVDFSRYSYAFPTALLVFGIFLLRSKKERPILFESIIALTWVLAAGWALAAIFVWQLPRIPIVEW